MTHLANLEAYNSERISLMQNAIYELNSNGFDLEMPTNPVSANYDIEFFKFGCSVEHARLINPYRLGYKNDFVETHLDIPHGVVCIQEAQRYLNSRRSANFPEWQSRWYEQHGHNGLDIFMDTQRPNLIDLNVRELATFIEIVKMDVRYDKFGNVNKVQWLIRKIDNNNALDLYLQSGKRAKEYYTEETVTANYNVFNCYDTHNCKGKFYNGREKEKFNLSAEVLDEMPDGFYNTKIKLEDKKKKDEKK